MIFQKDGVFCVETERTGLYIAPRGPLAEQLHYGRRSSCSGSEIFPFSTTAQHRLRLKGAGV